jgi:hypothetical protein
MLLQLQLRVIRLLPRLACAVVCLVSKLVFPRLAAEKCPSAGHDLVHRSWVCEERRASLICTIALVYCQCQTTKHRCPFESIDIIRTNVLVLANITYAVFHWSQLRSALSRARWRTPTLEQSCC